MTVWLKDGSVVDPVKGTVEKADLIIEKGRADAIPPPGRVDRGPDRHA